MMGSEPDPRMTRPQQPYSITFLPAGKTVRVDPEKIPYDRHGKPGSILEIAMGHEVEIDHACGGVAACSTCHVIVKSGHQSIAPADEQEEDMLDTAPGLTPRSRLACQAVPSGACDIVVEVPSWNRNHAKEGAH
ncbi:MAG: 2Fe-2S ferredoxin [Planctomycetota bacterium]